MIHDVNLAPGTVDRVVLRSANCVRRDAGVFGEHCSAEHVQLVRAARNHIAINKRPININLNFIERSLWLD